MLHGGVLHYSQTVCRKSDLCRVMFLSNSLRCLTTKTTCLTRSTTCCRQLQKMSLSTTVCSLKEVTPDNFSLEDTDGTVETIQKDFVSAQRRSHLPLMTSRPIKQLPIHLKPKQAWLESLSSVEDTKLGLLDLHPDVFATYPRIDILHKCVVWQKTYKKVNLETVKTRAEKRGGGRKPWPQKGSGRARHGSIRSPLWKGGGSSKGPRGPKSYWYVLPIRIRERGLRVALTVKYSQDYLHIVDSLDIPTPEPEYLEDLAVERYWGPTVLFVDHKPIEEISPNLIEATNRIKTYNVMSVEGLNVYSMLKHHTLVLTLDALNFLEDRLLYLMNRYTGDLKYDAIMSQQLNRIS
ncbi:large ribosomal subunit protein uL4m-like [Ptychodera flava]|uniref:large ribosomal subunit protein uL4m-like n=1 Tax=Ptychodera flava TaxID=63121 RepID=UPI00396A8B62